MWSNSSILLRRIASNGNGEDSFVIDELITADMGMRHISLYHHEYFMVKSQLFCTHIKLKDYGDF